ncbi:MAG: phosphoribosylamine--glycine ligase [Methanomicrobiales archaeon]|nr:phosphoribosylamine--glycine ligase [Methanomicrobiales archaeon]
MVMRVLVVGGGGREHAIADAIARSGGAEIYAMMGFRNPGIATLAKDCLIARDTEVREAVRFATRAHVDYAVIGPEAPLEAGIVDALEEQGIGCVGPSRAAARLETDKAFCRGLMEGHGIAGCPRYRVFYDTEEAAAFIAESERDLAIKPIGLTGGKGVRIIGEHLNKEEAIDYVKALKGGVVLEERLEGEEFTLQAFVDGQRIVPMPLVQDHKRAFEGDLGPNTGGMGSYSLEDHMLPFVSRRDYEKALSIMKDAVRVMREEGTPYRGILYGQFMNTAKGPMLVEFNARFGDPEAINVLSILSTNMTEIVEGIVEGDLTESDVSFERRATVCKYIVPEGYPERPRRGEPVLIGDIGRARLFYANIEERDRVLYTLNSRSCAVVGIGDSLEEAEQIAQKAAESIKGRVRFRRDIGTTGLLKRRIEHMERIR